MKTNALGYYYESQKEGYIAKITLTVEVNRQWVDNHPGEDALEYLKTRLNSSLGFRGKVKKMTAKWSKK